MTFSLSALDRASGMLGIAVASSSIAVGNRCAWARAGVGTIATQHRTDIRSGPFGLDLLARGLSARETVNALVAANDHPGLRQFAAVDRDGRTAYFNGPNIESIATAYEGDACVSVGNFLAHPDVTAAMVRGYERSGAGLFAERLLDALDAGVEAGGVTRTTGGGAVRSTGSPNAENSAVFAAGRSRRGAGTGASLFPVMTGGSGTTTDGVMRTGAGWATTGLAAGPESAATGVGAGDVTGAGMPAAGAAKCGWSSPVGTGLNRPNFRSSEITAASSLQSGPHCVSRNESSRNRSEFRSSGGSESLARSSRLAAAMLAETALVLVGWNVSILSSAIMPARPHDSAIVPASTVPSRLRHRFVEKEAGASTR